MQPNPEFSDCPKEFWANIRTISQAVGYTQRLPRTRGVRGRPGPIQIPTIAQIHAAFESLNLNPSRLITQAGKSTREGRRIINYFDYRATVLNEQVQNLLMNATEAEQLYLKLRAQRKAPIAVPLNKQSKEKKRPAYLTGIVNMLLHRELGDLPCDHDPQQLTTVTRDRAPFRTLARRIDGAFPSPVDPIAVWEIKEYYYTTTFGSRVADGVYESLLDGMELEELDAALQSQGAARGVRHIQHLLIVDAHFTWWVKGRSYLCRLIDMLNMGYVDEVLFGREVEQRLPVIAKKWVDLYRRRKTL